jgi:hypothetical protein
MYIKYDNTFLKEINFKDTSGNFFSLGKELLNWQRRLYLIS